MDQPNLVLYCECTHTDYIQPDEQTALIQGLRESGLTVITTPDLCGLAARQDPILSSWAQSPHLTLIACYPRAITWLFERAGAPLPQDGSVLFLNQRHLKPQQILDRLGINTPAESSRLQEHHAPSEDWVPWFPVIDRDRCRNCKLCLNFCLFGVYSTDEQGQVQVTQPDHCKNNCPACARVCPAQAIIFPKIDQSPINGDEVTDTTVTNKTNPLDHLQDTNIYDLLRQRSGRTQRFSSEPRNPGTMLELLHLQLDIPLEVLQALSPADLSRIQKKVTLPQESHD